MVADVVRSPPRAHWGHRDGVRTVGRHQHYNDGETMTADPATTAARFSQTTNSTAAPRLTCPVTGRSMRRALSAREIVLLAFYMKLDSTTDGDGIWPSIVRTARRFGWTPQDVNHTTRRLIARKLIEPVKDTSGKTLRHGKSRVIRVVKSHKVSLCDSHNLPLASPSYAALPQLTREHHQNRIDDLGKPLQGQQSPQGQGQSRWATQERNSNPLAAPITVPTADPADVAKMLLLRGSATDARHAERLAENGVEHNNRRDWKDGHGRPIGAPIMATVGLIESNPRAFDHATRREQMREMTASFFKPSDERPHHEPFFAAPLSTKEFAAASLREWRAAVVPAVDAAEQQLFDTTPVALVEATCGDNQEQRTEHQDEHTRRHTGESMAS